MTAPKANFATSGGALSVTDISVDVATKGVYANVSGANGLTSQHVRVWDYTAIEGDVTFSSSWAPTYAENRITGLTITDQAFDLFAQGLGLKAGGIAAMASIADYGVITSYWALDNPLSPPGGYKDLPVVPEPSTYLMMGIGLVGLALATRPTRVSR